MKKNSKFTFSAKLKWKMCRKKYIYIWGKKLGWYIWILYIGPFLSSFSYKCSHDPEHVGYAFQRFEMSFGFQSIYFKHWIDFPAFSTEKIDFWKIGFLVNFTYHRKPYTVHVKYSIRKSHTNKKNWNFFSLTRSQRILIGF